MSEMFRWSRALAVVAVLATSCSGDTESESVADHAVTATAAAPKASTTTEPRAIEMELVCSDVTSDGSRHQINLGDYRGSVSEAKRVLCPDAPPPELGSFENPVGRAGETIVTTDGNDEEWRFRVFDTTVYTEIDHPDIKMWWPDEPIPDKHVLVTFDIRATHVSGPPAEDFPPVDFKVIDGNRLLHEREFLFVEWADGMQTNSSIGGIPVGATDEWRVMVFVPINAADGSLIVLQPWGGGSSYFTID